MHKLLGKELVTYIVNVDKVSNTRAFSDVETSYVDVDDRGLVKTIYDPHNKYPRKYVIEETKNSNHIKIDTGYNGR